MAACKAGTEEKGFFVTAPIPPQIILGAANYCGGFLCFFWFFLVGGGCLILLMPTLQRVEGCEIQAVFM